MYIIISDGPLLLSLGHSNTPGAIYDHLSFPNPFFAPPFSPFGSVNLLGNVALLRQGQRRGGPGLGRRTRGGELEERRRRKGESVSLEEEELLSFGDANGWREREEEEKGVKESVKESLTLSLLGLEEKGLVASRGEAGEKIYSKVGGDLSSQISSET